MKKIISIILILLLVGLPFSFLLNVKAADVEFILSDTVTKSDDPNSKLITNNDVTITVTNLDSSGSLYAYKIINVFYNETTNEVSYEFTDDFQTFLDSNETYKELTIERYFTLTSDNPDGSASTSVITTSTLNELLSEYLINATLPSDKYTLSGSTGTATVEVGVYVLRAYKKKYLYGVMSVNAVPTVNENGEWIISNPTIVAKRSDVNPGKIIVTDEVANFDQSTMEITANYSVVFPDYPTNSPESQRTFKVLLRPGTIVEIMDGEEVLTINDGEVFKGDVKVANLNGSLTQITIPDVTKFASGSLTFNYTTSIEFSKLEYGSAGNSLAATVFWNPHVYTGSIDAYSMINARAKVYSISIKTQEKNIDDSYLTGAEYEIYRSYDSETGTLSDKVDIEFFTEENLLSTIVSDTGKYYIKQTKAPTGYRLAKDIIEVDVNSGSDNQIEDGKYLGVVSNETMWFLPSTGGIGTIIYTLIGLVIVGISMYGIVYYRQKKVSV